MKKKTKHIVIIILSVIVWLLSSIMVGNPNFDLIIRISILVIQLLAIWLGLWRSFRILEKMNAATKLLALIEQYTDGLHHVPGICSLIYYDDSNSFYKNIKYKKLLAPTKKQRLEFGKQPINKDFWFEPHDWEIRIKYLKSYL